MPPKKAAAYVISEAANYCFLELICAFEGPGPVVEDLKSWKQAGHWGQLPRICPVHAELRLSQISLRWETR